MKTVKFLQSNVKMVDVSEKKVVYREAIAQVTVTMKPSTIKLIKESKIPKGDVLTTAKVAGIMATKKTSEFIPLAHPLNVEYVDMNFNLKNNKIEIESKVKAQWKTGVEMEALIAAAVSALTIYDMCKSVDDKIVISNVKLVKKIKKTT